MRSRRVNRNLRENRLVNQNSMMKSMTLLLKNERQKHQATVDELKTILKEERKETNIFLKDMKKLLDDMEHIWPTNSTNHIQRYHVIHMNHIFFSFLLNEIVLQFNHHNNVILAMMTRFHVFQHNGFLLNFLSKSYRWIMDHILSP